MSIWDTYPSNYRSQEVQFILNAVSAGECVSLVGLSGAGKSNLTGFLTHRINNGPCFYFVDCNTLTTTDPAFLITVLFHTIDESEAPMVSFQTLSAKIRQKVNATSNGICFVLDRFDVYQPGSTETKAVENNLRALRDQFKYDLTFIISTRRPLDPGSELAELFLANTLWLGPLNHEDSIWSIQSFALRHGLQWNSTTQEQIYKHSQGYPSILRAICEAHASGIPLDLDTLRKSDAVHRRVKELWNDSPEEATLEKCGIQNHPFLSKSQKKISGEELTANEQRLMTYLNAHQGQICTKEDLIAAVWPEEKLIAGLRDDSLTQLIHRLREKLGPKENGEIQTLSGRGYRFKID